MKIKESFFVSFRSKRHHGWEIKQSPIIPILTRYFERKKGVFTIEPYVS